MTFHEFTKLEEQEQEQEQEQGQEQEQEQLSNFQDLRTASRGQKGGKK